MGGLRRHEARAGAIARSNAKLTADVESTRPLAGDLRRLSTSLTVMIYSLGIDIIEIERVREALRRHPKMALRLFTAQERAYCEERGDPAAHFAARFAAKEATAKALGRWLRWQEVEVVSGPTGRPNVSLSGEAAVHAQVARGRSLVVSLSHSRDYAVACVALVGPQEMPWFDEKLPSGSACA